ncbi:MAG: MFS transporter [Planctomycetota bacterium]|nr:MFS transporter [Planctomycetota bacterium]
MNDSNDKRLFWACFTTLIATSFGFVTRFAILNEWGRQFNLNSVQLGEIGGVGVWPFAISIILFSLIIDKIGYGKAMVFAFICHITYGVVVICAPLMLAPDGASPDAVLAGQKSAYWMLYVGSFIFAIGNGTVEAVVNPVVATMFSKEKTKWLNILHAGWPGGLVLAGMMTIALGTVDWRWKIALIFLPVLTYGFLMLGRTFPVNERVAAGGTYKGMLKEFGVLAALVVVGLIVRQLGDVFKDVPSLSLLGDWKVQLGIAAVLVGAFGAYTQSLGRPMLFFLMLIMIPLATTELGTDGWITSLMEPFMEMNGYNAAWVLVYTSFIMMVLRFFAGPIVHRISPLGLLAVSSIIAAIGLYSLSAATGMLTLFLAATLYGFGKTFFWPTMLGVVSEQCPRGGALTLNAVGGVGMLAVGVLGFPFIGLLQVNEVSRELNLVNPELHAKIVEEKQGIFGPYTAVSSEKVAALTPLVQQARKIEAEVKKAHQPEDTAAIATALAKNSELQGIINTPEYKQQLAIAQTVQETTDRASKGALAYMAIFPCIMLLCYLGLIAYFRSRGGYAPVHLDGADMLGKPVATVES